MKVAEICLQIHNNIAGGHPCFVGPDEKLYLPDVSERNTVINIGRWGFEVCGPLEEGFPGLITRTDGVRIIFVKYDGIRRGDGSIDGIWTKDIAKACMETIREMAL